MRALFFWRHAVLIAALLSVPGHGAAQSTVVGEQVLKQVQVLLKHGNASIREGDRAGAIPFYEKAFALYEAALGLSAPATVSTGYELAGLYESAGQQEKALALRRRLDEIETARREALARELARRRAEQERNEALRRERETESRREYESEVRRESASRDRQQQQHERQQAERSRAQAELEARQRESRDLRAEEPYRPPRRSYDGAAFSSPPAASESLPSFPWPPATPSAQLDLPHNIFEPNARQLTLALVGEHLVNALKQARYFEYRFYRVANGFALVARLERIGADGTPLPDTYRFLLPGSREPFSVGVYIRRLFFAPEGYYRQITFVVTDRPFTAKDEKLDAAAAARLVSKGANRLPDAYEQMPFTAAHRVTALIYEFRKGSTDGDVATLTPGRFDGRVHLDRAGIYPALLARR